MPIRDAKAVPGDCETVLLSLGTRYSADGCGGVANNDVLQGHNN